MCKNRTACMSLGVGLFGDYQTARLMQASSSYPVDLHAYFLGIAQGQTTIYGEINRGLSPIVNTGQRVKIFASGPTAGSDS